MSLPKEHDESQDYNVINYEKDEDLPHKKLVRKQLDAILEHKRLKAELEDYEGELDDEFDWDMMDKG